MHATPLSVFAYSDYRSFLKDFYRHVRRQDRKFSHRYIASKLGLNSSSWFADLVKGRNNLSGSHLVKLIKLLSLKDSEADYFEILVRYNQAGTIEEKSHYFRKLGSFRELNSDIVGREKFDYYRQWYYAVIRELLFFLDFRGDYEALGKKLVPAVSALHAREAVALLEKLDFVRKNAQGVHKPRPITLKKDSSTKSPFADGFLIANMELAMKALERFPKEDRHVSALTLSYSKEGFQKAVKEIETLRKNLIAMMDVDPYPDRVFQCNVQFFPVTERG